MTCRHVSRSNIHEYCVTCALWGGRPARCTLNEEPSGLLEKEPGTKNPRRGNKGKVAARRQRAINTLIERGKASSFVAYRPVAAAIEAAGLP